MVVPRKHTPSLSNPIPLLVVGLVEGQKPWTDFIPVGQAAYNSNITLHSEYLPVSVDIMGKYLLSP